MSILVNWVNAAILSAAIMGVVNITDSHLLSKRMPGFRAFLLPVAIALFFFVGAKFSDFLVLCYYG